MKLKNVADIIFAFPVKGEKDAHKEILWLTTQNLMENNIVNKLERGLDFVPDSELKVAKGDVILRRVRPQFVNYIDIDEECYMGQNLALIRANELIDAKYLAYMLETAILDMTLCEGSIIPSVSRKELMDIDIGMLPSREHQKAIGELWWLQSEKKKKTDKLMQLEKTLLKAKLKQLTNNIE